VGFLNNRFISVKKAIIIDDQKKSVVETCQISYSSLNYKVTRKFYNILHFGLWRTKKLDWRQLLRDLAIKGYFI